MARYRVCKVCGDLHDVAAWPDNHREWKPDNRSELAAPMVVRDTMDPVQGQHDGRMYESKRALRRSYREHGLIEVGDDKSHTDPEYLRPQAAAEVRRRREAGSKAVEAAVETALSQTGFGAC